MPQTYTRWKGLIQTVADFVGGALKIALGTPAGKMEYPTGTWDESIRSVWDTGVEWTLGTRLQTILSQIGDEADTWTVAWATVLTNATGVVPTVAAGRFISGVTKNEGTNELTATVTPTYLAATFCVVGSMLGLAAVPLLSAQTANTFTLSYINAATGVTIGINSRTAHLLAVGVM